MWYLLWEIVILSVRSWLGCNKEKGLVMTCGKESRFRGGEIYYILMKGYNDKSSIWICIFTTMQYAKSSILNVYYIHIHCTN